MKKLLIIVACGFFVTSIFAQGIPAPITIQKKKAVLELYSGIYCQFCPIADKEAEKLAEDHPGDFIIVDIQNGIYAVPNGGDPDYRTPFGDGLQNLIDLTGYPAGVINRHVFPNWGQEPNGLAMAPTRFAAATSQMLAEDASANIGVEAELDVQSRLLTVRVQVYYTGNPSSTTNKLSVAILQDNLIGPQIIGSNVTPDPDLVLPNDQYLHNNMLRHLMTTTYGENIAPALAGSRIDRTYTYQINDSIYEIPAVLGDLKIVVFLAENTKEIINAELVKPVFTNFLYTLDSRVVEAGINSAVVCGAYINTPNIKFMNNGSQTLTSLVIDYTINGSIQSTYQWLGSVAPVYEQQITLDPIKYYPLETNTLTVTTRVPNGSTDEDTSNDDASFEFVSALDASNTVTMELQLDYWGSEVNWELVNSSNAVLYRGGPYPDVPDPNSNPPLPALITQDFTLPSGDCYEFVATDEFGDGILFNNTGFTLRDDEGLVIVFNYADYNSEGSISFGVDVPKVDSCVVFTCPTGVLNADILRGIEIYPNLASEKITIKLSSAQTGDLNVYMTNTLGQAILTFVEQKVTENTEIQIDASQFSPGIYFMNLVAGGKQYSEKIVITF